MLCGVDIWAESQSGQRGAAAAHCVGLLMVTGLHLSFHLKCNLSLHRHKADLAQLQHMHLKSDTVQEPHDPGFPSSNGPCYQPH
eukprot:6463118-Amphidinium_carterae.1